VSDLYLIPVPILERIDGEERAVKRYAIVSPVAADPADPHRVLVRVVDGLGVLEDNSTASVELSRLLSREEAEARLAAHARPEGS